MCLIFMKWKCWLFSHVQLFAIPWTVSHQAPLSMGILQARILEWVAVPSSSWDFPNPGIEPRSHTLQADFLLSEPPENQYKTFIYHKLKLREQVYQINSYITTMYM